MIKTDAINLCLRYIGEAPLPVGITIDQLDPQHEAVIINQILDETSAKIQLQGWWFNTETWEFQPDSTTNKIQIPPNVLFLEPTDGSDYVLRGQFLYNRVGKSYSFTEPVEATVVWDLKYEELPTSFAFYVAYNAAKEAQMLFSSDSTIDKDLTQRITEAYIRLNREHMRYKNHNLISGSTIISRTVNPTGVV